MKIFGIGLSKTGTTSLAHALDILGYKVKDCLGLANFKKGHISSIDKTALQSHDALTDTPIPSFYRELDVEFPNSKFILTIREMDAWLNSCKKQFNQKLADKQTEAHNQLFMDLYDTTVFDEEKFRAGYKRFVEGVLEYFKDRPDDLLVIDISNGEGWEKLCPFLGKPAPNIPFPKSNVTQIAWLNPINLAQAVRDSSAGLYKLCGWKTGCEQGDHTNSGTQYPFLKGALSRFELWWRRNKLIRTKQQTLALITRHLRNLKSDIPIISEDQSSIPLERRDHWNHFWLVDIDIGSDTKTQVGQEFTPVINVALIQDRTPFLGVVYSPHTDVIYCSAMNKGAFKIVRGGEPQRILPNEESLLQFADPILSPREDHAIKTTSPENNWNFTWNACVAAEEGRHLDGIYTSTKEWQTAAANALLKELGAQLIDSETGKELEYNKKDWTNKSIQIIKSK